MPPGVGTVNPTCSAMTACAHGEAGEPAIRTTLLWSETPALETWTVSAVVSSVLRAMRPTSESPFLSRSFAIERSGRLDERSMHRRDEQAWRSRALTHTASARRSGPARRANTIRSVSDSAHETADPRRVNERRSDQRPDRRCGRPAHGTCWDSTPSAGLGAPRPARAADGTRSSVVRKRCRGRGAASALDLARAWHFVAPAVSASS